MTRFIFAALVFLATPAFATGSPSNSNGPNTVNNHTDNNGLANNGTFYNNGAITNNVNNGTVNKNTQLNTNINSNNKITKTTNTTVNSNNRTLNNTAKGGQGVGIGQGGQGGQATATGGTGGSAYSSANGGAASVGNTSASSGDVSSSNSLIGGNVNASAGSSNVTVEAAKRPAIAPSLGNLSNGPCSGVSGGLSIGLPGFGTGIQGGGIDDQCTLRYNIEVVAKFDPELAREMVEDLEGVKAARERMVQRRPLPPVQTKTQTTSIEIQRVGSTPITERNAPTNWISYDFASHTH